MTFLVRHRMKQSNPKLTKHEGTHLSLEKYCNLRGDQAWDNGNLNLDLLISKSPFFAVCDRKPSSQHGDVCFRMQKKSSLFVCFSAPSAQLPQWYVKYRVLQRFNMAVPCFMLIQCSLTCNPINSDSDKPVHFVDKASVGLDIVFHHIPMGGCGISMDRGVIHSWTLGRTGKTQPANLTVHETQKPPWSTGHPQG